MLIMLILHMSFGSLHWGSLNSKKISCSNNSFLECSPPTAEARFDSWPRVSRPLVQDGDDLHSGDPDVIQTQGLKSACYSGCVTCRCYSGNSNCLLILLILHLSFRSLHWGSQVEVPNSNNISCSNNSPGFDFGLHMSVSGLLV
jgi:hypothetical protein